ncbi:MAG: hypothetical protein A2086_15260 [Spirochaetes bacterium GWD1_27_9]|nr:MAG: hypothetical protein A2Z98_05930 [Spirochaetes bacterium GWB1_27_13]OHD25189.1 MAG: hypothetical protein A2Y34_15010 [Spirochaetes bacterium GWC1_27_15]OHD31255.1 MAG: hypothetical protein A2086_15260 [Spirochaetes bacterium GWD1_27_9]
MNSLTKKRFKINFRLKIITKYVLKEFIPTFFITFMFFFVIFIINHILLFIKPLFEKDVPLDLIFMLLLTALPMYTIFCLPFGVLLATLMTMGRFSSDNEIVAFRALGFSIMQIFAPIFICGIFITLIAFYINDRMLPIALIEQNNVKKKIMYLKPTLDFKSKTVKNYYGKTLITDIVQNTSIDGLIIIDEDENNQKRIICTKKALITPPKDRPNAIEIKMNSAMIQFENKDRQGEFNYGYSKSISYFISLQEDVAEDSVTSGNEKTTLEIYNDVKKTRKDFLMEKQNKDYQYFTVLDETKSYLFDTEQFLKGNISNVAYFENLQKTEVNISSLYALKQDKSQNRQLNYNLLELYRKFALPIACIIFTIFASPIGIYSKRAGKSIGFILGLFLCAIYWFSYYAGQILGIRMLLPPFIAIFFTNAFFLVIGVYFLLKRLKE